MKKVIGLLIILLLIGCKDKHLYGNNNDSIIEVINSFDLYKDKTIKLLEIRDYGNDRVVAFLSNDDPSIIEFDRDENGNYIRPRTETHHNVDLSHFLIYRLDEENTVVVLHIKNQYSDIKEFTFKANEDEYEVAFVTNDEDVQWTELDKSMNKSYSFKWFYQDD